LASPAIHTATPDIGLLLKRPVLELFPDVLESHTAIIRQLVMKTTTQSNLVYPEVVSIVPRRQHPIKQEWPDLRVYWFLSNQNPECLVAQTTPNHRPTARYLSPYLGHAKSAKQVNRSSAGGIYPQVNLYSFSCFITQLGVIFY
jgi:hypothetical protein